MSTQAEWKARPAGPEYEATRRAVVEAAEAIVREQGVRALRFEAVADRVGLHRSSLYRYFDSKEELLTAVVVHASLRVGQSVIAQLGADASPRAFLVEGLTLALAELASDPVHRSLLDPSASEAMARVGGRALTEGIRPLVEPAFVAAAEQGILRPGVTPDDALRWLQIVAVGLLRTPGTTPDADDQRTDDATADLTRLLDLMLVPTLFTP